ncbi:MAG: S8/S53 family peptidase [Polyangiaceae bacterium]
MNSKRFIVDLPQTLDVIALRGELNATGQLRSLSVLASPRGRVILSVALDQPSLQTEKFLRQRVAQAGGRIARDRALVPSERLARDHWRGKKTVRQSLVVQESVGGPTFDGRGVKLALIDKHGVAAIPVFDGRLSTLVFDEANGYVAGPHVVSPGDVEGTNVASVAVGDSPMLRSPAPKAQLAAYKADWESEMIAAIDHAMTDKDVKLIFTAWHLVARNPEEPALLEEAIARARANHVLFLAAAGNTGKVGSMLEPAVIQQAFAVGTYVDGLGGARAAPDSGDSVAFDSTYGPVNTRKPDFLEFRGAYDVVDPDGSFSAAGGTSMAVARAAGVLATWYQGLRGIKVTVAMIEDILETTCLQLLENGVAFPANAQGLGALQESKGLEAVLRVS